MLYCCAIAIAALQHSRLLAYTHPVSPQPGYWVAPAAVTPPRMMPAASARARLVPSLVTGRLYQGRAGGCQAAGACQRRSDRLKPRANRTSRRKEDLAMHAPTPRHGTRALPLVATLLTAAVLVTACATLRATMPAASTTTPKVLTVPQIANMILQGEAINIIYG